MLSDQEQNDNPGWGLLMAAAIAQAVRDARKHDISARDWLLVDWPYEYLKLTGHASPLWLYRTWVLSNCKGKPRNVIRPRRPSPRRRKVATNDN